MKYNPFIYKKVIERNAHTHYDRLMYRYVFLGFQSYCDECLYYIHIKDHQETIVFNYCYLCNPLSFSNEKVINEFCIHKCLLSCLLYTLLSQIIPLFTLMCSLNVVWRVTHPGVQLHGEFTPCQLIVSRAAKVCYPYFTCHK